jgi:hypothetical protein
VLCPLSIEFYLHVLLGAVSWRLLEGVTVLRSLSLQHVVGAMLVVVHNASNNIIRHFKASGSAGATFQLCATISNFPLMILSAISERCRGLLIRWLDCVCSRIYQAKIEQSFLSLSAHGILNRSF